MKRSFIDYASPTVPDNQPGQWRVGTLVYTTGGLVALFAVLLMGDFAWSVKDRVLQPLPPKVLAIFNTPVWYVGLLVGSIPAAVGMVVGPIVSVKSDRHRGRWGRRIPFLLIPAPFVAISLIGLGYSGQLGTWLHGLIHSERLSENNCQIAVFSLIWGCYDIASAVAGALIGALVNDVVPQKVIGRFNALFRMVSLLVGIFFFYFVMKYVTAHYVMIFVVAGIVSGVGFSLMCLLVKEGDYPPPPPRPPAHSFIAPVKAYVRECFEELFFLVFFIATILGGLANVPVNQYSVYHATSVGLSDDVYGKATAISYVLSLALAYPLGLLADRFHPLRVGCFGLLLYAVAMMWSFAFGVTPRMFFIAYVLHTVLAGVYLTGSASIGQRLLPRARYAEVASAGGIISAITYMIFAPSLGLLVTLLHKDYRIVFLVGSVIAILAAGAYAVLLMMFKERGGDAAYVAPE
jgi:MFS family permease